MSEHLPIFAEDTGYSLSRIRHRLTGWSQPKTGYWSLRQMAPCDTVNLSHARACLGGRALGPPAGPRPPPSPVGRRGSYIRLTIQPVAAIAAGGTFRPRSMNQAQSSSKQ